MRRWMIGAALGALALGGGAANAQQRDAKGALTRSAAEARAAARFDQLDANHDGKLDEADRAAHLAQVFDQADTNHDGQLSRDEFLAMHERGPGAPEHGGASPGMHGGMGRMHHPVAGKPGPGGATTKSEFVADALRRFDAADTNHDGVLSRQEREAEFGKMRAKWHAHGGADAPPPPPPGGPDAPPPPPPDDADAPPPPPPPGG